MKKIIILVVFILLAGLIGFRIYQNKAPKAGGRSRPGRVGTVAVVVQPVLHESIRDVRTFTGTLFPRAQFDVAPKVAGRLESLLVNIGSEVRKNALIATLDSQEYKQQVEQYKAELDVARASVNDTQSALEIALRELERTRELRKQEVASVAEMDKVEAQHKAALAKHEIVLAKVKQQEAALKAAEIRLSYTQIHASWTGGSATRVVGERYADEGAMLRANDPIVSILDIETMLAALFIVEQDYPLVLVGQPTVVTSDAFPGQSFPGKIVRKAPMLKESSRQARMEIEIPNPDRLLAPGMFVRAEIELARHEQATTVPVSALARRNGDVGVFLADPVAMKARFIPVTVGISTRDRAEILEPPLDGVVVTLGHHLLEDGGAIIIPESAPPPSEADETPAAKRENSGGAR